MSKPKPKSCYDCRHFAPLDDPSADPECALAAARPELRDFVLLRTIKFQRASGFITDCGPGARDFEHKA